MISYLIEGTILATVVAIGIRLHFACRELRRLRGYHGHYQFVLDETAAAATAIDTAIRDLNTHGAQILLALGERIGDGHRVIGEIDERMDAVAEHYEAERDAASNVLQFAAAAGKAAVHRPEENFDKRKAAEQRDAEDFGPEPSRRPAPRRSGQAAHEPTARRTQPAEMPMKWPTLGERFNAWRNSDGQEPRTSPKSRQGR